MWPLAFLAMSSVSYSRLQVVLCDVNIADTDTAILAIYCATLTESLCKDKRIDAHRHFPLSLTVIELFCKEEWSNIFDLWSKSKIRIKYNQVLYLFGWNLRFRIYEHVWICVLIWWSLDEVELVLVHSLVKSAATFISLVAMQLALVLFPACLLALHEILEKSTQFTLWFCGFFQCSPLGVTRSKEGDRLSRTLSCMWTVWLTLNATLLTEAFPAFFAPSGLKINLKKSVCSQVVESEMKKQNKTGTSSFFSVCVFFFTQWSSKDILNTLLQLKLKFWLYLTIYS